MKYNCFFKWDGKIWNIVLNFHAVHPFLLILSKSGNNFGTWIYARPSAEAFE